MVARGPLTRRQLLAGTAAAGVSVALGSAAGGMDPNLSVFISDIHVPGTDVPPEHPLDVAWPDAMRKALAGVVDEILSMSPRPSRVVVFGDIAYLKGRTADYLASRTILDRLVAAGIELVLGMGNHDRRPAFFTAWPEEERKSAVPGHVVRMVSLGTCDLALVDTLHQDLTRLDRENPGDGVLGASQVEWMRASLSRRTRPFFVGGHHGVKDVAAHGVAFSELLLSLPGCIGYIHGHEHLWSREVFYQWHGRFRVMKTLGLPSTGFFGDIGYVVFRTDATGAEARLVQRDFYIPRYRPPEGRPGIRSDIVRENDGQTIRFEYASLTAFPS